MGCTLLFWDKCGAAVSPCLTASLMRTVPAAAASRHCLHRTYPGQEADSMASYLFPVSPASAQTRKCCPVKDTGERVMGQATYSEKHLPSTRLIQGLYSKHAEDSFKTVLLSYNSHATQFTHVNCIIPWF